MIHTLTMELLLEKRNNTKVIEKFGKVLSPYKNHLKTQHTWSSFRKQHPELQLPSVSTLVLYFDTWNRVKEAFEIESDNGIKQKEYIELLSPYTEYLKSIAKWNEYRINHPELRLPSSQTLTKYFGSWNKFKLAMGIDEVIYKCNNWKTLPQKEYVKLLLPYKDYLKTIQRWIEFRNQNPSLKRKVPSFSTLILHFGSWGAMQKAVGVPSKKLLSPGVKCQS